MKTSHILVSGTVMALSLLVAPLAQAQPGDHYRGGDRYYQNYDNHRHHQQYQRGYHRPPPSKVVIVTPPPPRYYESREVYRYNNNSYNRSYNSQYRSNEKNRFSFSYSGSW